MLQCLLKILLISSILSCITWMIIMKFSKHRQFNIIRFLFLYLMFFVIVTFSAVSYMNIDTKKVPKDDFQQMLPLSSFSEVQGNYFVGTYYSKDKSYYYFYTKDGSKQLLNKVPTKDVQIVKDNKQKYEKKYTILMVKFTPGTFQRELLKLLKVNMKNYDWHQLGKDEDVKTILHVPENGVEDLPTEYRQNGAIKP